MTTGGAKKHINSYTIKALLSIGLVVVVIFSVSADHIWADSSPDAIAIRVMPNISHYSASRWYKEQHFQGSPQSVVVDDYEAVRDGRTVYVNAANIDDINHNGRFDAGELFTNIYIISFNQMAESATNDIFGQILSHWKFNSNVTEDGSCSEASDTFCLSSKDCPAGEYCQSLKAKIVRDVKRMGDVAEMKFILNEYKGSNSSYPDLAAGTYLPNKTISTWPSWQNTLGQALGSNLPVDPINKMGPCSGYDPTTCWNEKTKRFAGTAEPFEMPGGSFGYMFNGSADRSTIDVCAVMESGLVVAERDGGCRATAHFNDEVSLPIDTIDRVNLPQVHSGHPFISYVEATQSSANRLYWEIATSTTNWNLWSNAPVLLNTKVIREKEVYADAAGKDGNYAFAVIADDRRGKTNSRTVKGYSVKVFNEPPVLTFDNVVNYTASSTHELDYRITIHDDPLNYPIIYRLLSGSLADIPGLQANLYPEGDNYIFRILGKPTPSCLMNTSSAYCNTNGYIAAGNRSFNFNYNFIEKYELLTPAAFTFNIFNHRPVFDAMNCTAVARRFLSYPGCTDVRAHDEDKNKIYYIFNADNNYYFNNSANNELSGNPLSGYITGTPRTRGTSTIVVNVIDEYGASSTASYDLRVNNWCQDGIIDGDWDHGVPNDYGILEECADGNNGDADACNNNCKWTCKGLDRDFTQSQADNIVFSQNGNPDDMGDSANGTFMKLAFSMPTPYIWIPASDSGQISKIRTFDGFKRTCSRFQGQVTCTWDKSVHENRGDIIGIYSVGASPSRVAVNAETGDVWVANRDSMNVMKLDNNGQILKTCSISDITGNVNTSPKGLALDAAGDIWVGTDDYGDDGKLIKLSGDDSNCQSLRTVSVGGGHFSLAVDSDGYLWIANRNGARIQKFDPNNADDSKAITPYPVSDEVCGGNSKRPDSIVIDFNDNVWSGTTCNGIYSVNKLSGQLSTISFSGLTDPNGRTRDVAIDVSGAIWSTQDMSNQLVKIPNPANPDPSSFQRYNTNGSFPIGIIGDATGQIWSINYNSSNVNVFNMAGNDIADYNINNHNVSAYAHADMTGFNRALINKKGQWLKTYDGAYNGQHWGKVGWQQTILSVKQSILIELRASDQENMNGSGWINASAWNTYRLQDDRKKGRYLQMRVTMTSRQAKVTPVLWDLKINCN